MCVFLNSRKQGVKSVIEIVRCKFAYYVVGMDHDA